MTGAPMSDDQDAKNKQPEGGPQPPAASGFPLKPSGAVVVTHLDSPPPSGKRTIHPRRPAPIVPDRPAEKTPETSPQEEGPKGATSDSEKP